MGEKMAYIFDNYLVEFVKDDRQIIGEVFYPGETTPVGKISCHYYNYSDPEDRSHTKDDSLHIDILRVQVDHDNKGIGTFLMKKIIEYVDKGKIKHVTTTPSPTARISMDSLRRFYLKFRFGSGFLTKKIEFVDEQELLADVIEMANDDAVSRAKKEEADKDKTSESTTVTNANSNEKTIKPMKAGKVGYLTIVHFLDEELESKNDILQIGASGAEVYGIYLSMKGHNVTVVEPDKLQCDILKIKEQKNKRLTIQNEPFSYLEKIPDNSKDAVLCFGPMYSALKFEEKQKIVMECYRVCKEGGVVFVSFMSNEMVVIDNIFNNDYDYICGPKFDSITLKAVMPDKRLLTTKEIDVMFSMCNIKYSRRFAAEGISMLLRDKMENMNERQFNNWMQYHYTICENPEFIGFSQHIVYVIEKPVTTQEENDDE